jgi:NitT/TauT family transport system ATP-binding protein
LSALLLRCHGLAKRHVALSGHVVEALDDVSLKLHSGRLLSIVGPSGSGKSTLLDLIAGVLPPTRGEVRFGSTSPPRMGYVLQSNALFPWLTVRRNLSYALDLQGLPRAEADAHAEQLCRQLGLSSEAYLDKLPRELSGGEQRRVAIGMALAPEPELLLLDEPGSALDYEARWAIQALVQNIAMQRGLAVVCVTHDLEEAVFLGDEVLVLRAGRVADRFPIDLPRPRKDAVRASSEFNAFRRRLMTPHATE